MEAALDVLCGRWATPVIRELLRGDRSFSEMRQALPRLPDKVLADRLAHLLQSGVLERRREAEWPPRSRYALTPHGRRLGPILDALRDWGEGLARER